MNTRREIKIGIHQPNFFPWLGYFHKLSQSDIFIILDTVDIVLGSAKSITHRVKIKSNGGEKWLSLPIIKGQSKIIKDIELNNNSEWRVKLINQVGEYYRKAPYFEEVFPFVSDCINNEVNNLSEYNIDIIEKVARKMKIDTPIIRASELNVSELDRNKRLIQLIQEVNGNIYLSGKGGKSYHDETLFVENNISIEYLNYIQPEYKQLHGTFIPGLSVLDYLFNNYFNQDAL